MLQCEDPGHRQTPADCGGCLPGTFRKKTDPTQRFSTVFMNGVGTRCAASEESGVGKVAGIKCCSARRATNVAKRLGSAVRKSTALDRSVTFKNRITLSGDDVS